MSISTSNNQNRKAIIKKEGGISTFNVKKIMSTALKSLPGKPLELILVFAFITTSIGELFGRNYGWKWYSIIILILVLFVVKELVDSKPKIEIKHKTK